MQVDYDVICCVWNDNIIISLQRNWSYPQKTVQTIQMRTEIGNLSQNRTQRISSYTGAGRQWMIIAIWMPLKITSTVLQKLISILRRENTTFKANPAKGIKPTGTFQVNGIKHIAKLEVNGIEFLAEKQVSHFFNCLCLSCMYWQSVITKIISSVLDNMPSISMIPGMYILRWMIPPG